MLSPQLKMLLFITISSLIVMTQSFKPYGSRVPDTCSVSANSCPSHYLCERERGDIGKCRCYRYFGFYGPTCDTLSFASYLLVAICLSYFVLSTCMFSLNVQLYKKLQAHHKLSSYIKANLVCNMLSTFTPVMAGMGDLLIVLNVDKNMFFMENLWVAYFAYTIVIFFLSCMGISVFWVETLERVKNNQESYYQYKLMLYTLSVLYVFAIIFSSFIFYTLPTVAMLGTIVIGCSYHYGGQMVAKTLRGQQLHRVTDISLVSLNSPSNDALRLAALIEDTARIMTIYSLLMVMCFVVSSFTQNTTTPLYEGQNDLPRWAQGQLSKFAAMLVGARMNFEVINYFYKTVFRVQLCLVPCVSYQHGSMRLSMRESHFTPHNISPRRQSIENRLFERNETIGAAATTTTVVSVTSTEMSIVSEEGSIRRPFTEESNQDIGIVTGAADAVVGSGGGVSASANAGTNVDVHKSKSSADCVSSSSAKLLPEKAPHAWSE